MLHQYSLRLVKQHRCAGWHNWPNYAGGKSSIIIILFPALLSLKWYYTQFSVQKFGCNYYLFQMIAIYNDERQMTMSAMIKA